MTIRTRYRIGRSVASAGIGLGWCAAAALVAWGGMAGAREPDISRLIGVLLGLLVGGMAGTLLGLVNHGFWQLAIAVFDIADHTAPLPAEAPAPSPVVATRPPPVTRRPPPPDADKTPPEGVPAGPPLPPVVLPNGPRPGETDEQWAQRIEREEAAAFRQRHR